MTDIPTTEPDSARAGDTWKWRRDDLSDYPATTWTLKYAFKNAADHFEVTAAADGTAHAVTIAAATTAGYTAGGYDWAAFVESGSERYTVDSGRFTVLPAFANTSVLDNRTDARIIYEALVAAYKSYQSTGALRQSYTIGTRTMVFKKPEELLKEMDYWRSQVAAEDAAARIANGLGGGRVVVRL